MDTVALSANFGEPWAGVEALRIGSVPSSGGSPDVFALVEREGCPHLRVDLYRGPEEFGVDVFHEVIIWSEFVVIGVWEHVYFVNLDANPRRVLEFDLGAYFGEMKPTASRLLVASGKQVFSFDANGRLEWKSVQLGIDGIVLESVQAEIVRGAGEWDPPGGWRPFILSAASGEVLHDVV
jgi:hypothetical protein